MAEEVQPIGAGVPETAERDGAFPRLDDEQRARLLRLGRLRPVEQGDVLFEAGDATSDFFVIESGAVAIVQGYREENRIIALHGRHRFTGEMSLLSGQRLYLTGVVRDPGELIQVPLERLREIVAEDKGLSDVILGAFMARRAILIGLETGIKLIGSRFSPDSRRLREFLVRNRMPHQWTDLEIDEDADAMLSELGIKPDETPVVVASDGTVLRNPSYAELGRAIGLGSAGPPPALCDVIVVGAGPAGLSASLYAASEGLDVQALEAVAPGGQAGTSARIENYLGFPAGISGDELTQRAGVQALKFGSRLTSPAEALQLDSHGGRHEIRLSNGDVVAGRTLVIATGARYRRLDVPRLEEFEGGGVYYAASQAEAQMCSGDPVIVVGGGNSAGQAAMFLSKATLGLPPSDPRRRPREVHVALSRRPGRAQRRDRGLPPLRGRSPRGRSRAPGRDDRRQPDGRASERSPRKPSSSSSAPSRIPNGSKASWRVTMTGSCSRAATSRATTSRSSTASARCSSRPAAQGSSPLATSTPAR